MPLHQADGICRPALQHRQGGQIMKEKLFTARTVEEAKQAAALDFGVSEDIITFEILEEPRKGLFGMLKGEARVKASVSTSPAEDAVVYLRDVLTAMDVSGLTISVAEVEGGAVLNLEGEGLGVIIGRRGETLDALQYLASLVCNRNTEDYYRITVDSSGYREKRKTTLEGLARKIAKNVSRTGRSSALEPMNPYERRIIHAAVSEIEGVTSRSTGEEPYRKVIITSTEKRPPRAGGRPEGNTAARDDNNRRGGRGAKRRPGGGRGGKREEFATSFEKEYKQNRQLPHTEYPDDMEPLSTPTKAIEKEKSSQLYTKIDI